MVPSPNAVINHRTMMIKSLYAFVAFKAMPTPICPNDFAFWAQLVTHLA